MKAYKFLRRGAIAPISDLAWPTPALATGTAPGGLGAWVEAGRPLAPCRSGIHACRIESLAYWLHDELWEIELGGECIEAEDLVVAQRAQLVRHVEAWVGGVATRFLHASRRHAGDLTEGASPAGKERARMWIEAATYHVEHGNVALGAYTAAMGVARLDAEVPDEKRFRQERVWQARFIASELGLSEA